MRTLYFAIMLFTMLPVAQAAKVDAIDDVQLTPCLTTRIQFNQEALKAYQGVPLTLKIDDEANGKSYSEIINLQKNIYTWEKAIPFGETLIFTVLKNGEPISYPFSKGTTLQLAKIIAPSQVAQADTQTNTLIRGTAELSDKKNLSILLTPEQRNKELLAVVTSVDGRLLWQYYGKTDKALIASIPADTAAPQKRVILSNIVCNTK